jgi:predicted house-cleaning noncanonical NTP pyrophosphatase (MazG superfamily)
LIGSENHFGDENLIKYNKAVRDKIPEIIKSSGKNCNIKKLDDSEFLVELEKKLIEEISEYQKSKDIGELADILEVIYRISELKGMSLVELDDVRKTKSEKRGKFDDNLFLVDADK